MSILRVFLVLFLVCVTGYAAESTGFVERYRLDPIDVSKLVIKGASHNSSTIDVVKYDVYDDGSSPMGAVVYCFNTGRKQLTLTPGKHLSIFKDLISDGYTVIVADFSGKTIDPGIALEKYVVTLSENARKAASGTSTPTKDYFPVMPGFTVERNVVYFRYSDVPRPLQKLIARQKKKKYTTKHENKTATMDIIYPKYGPPVPVIGNYGSSSQGKRQDYFATAKRHMVMSFALKNMAISHHHHWLDPYCGYTSPRGVTYYGNQFALKWVHFICGTAMTYNIDSGRIVSFGHSKGSEVPGKLVNRLRQTGYIAEDLTLVDTYSEFADDFLALSLADRTLKDPYSAYSGEIKMAIATAGIANFWMYRNRQMPWGNHPMATISPFFIVADHQKHIRGAMDKVVALAKAHNVEHAWAFMDSHDWPNGKVYDTVSAFADEQLGLKANQYGHAAAQKNNDFQKE